MDAGASAKTLDRPGPTRALDMLRRGDADALVVVKLDRLTRSVRDLGDLVSGPFAPGRAVLLSVSEQIDTRTAAGRLVLNVLASVSQWEREAIGERTSAAMQHKKSAGEYTGGRVPYGFRVGDDGRVAPIEASRWSLPLHRNLPDGVVDRPDLSGKTVTELFEEFCKMASITHVGSFSAP